MHIESCNCRELVTSNSLKCKSIFAQGMIAGHAYYFLEDVYPRMTGRRPLRTPGFIKSLFADEPVVMARPANVRFAPPPLEEDQQN